MGGNQQSSDIAIYLTNPSPCVIKKPFYFAAAPLLHCFAACRSVDCIAAPAAPLIASLLHCDHQLLVGSLLLESPPFIMRNLKLLRRQRMFATQQTLLSLQSQMLILCLRAALCVRKYYKNLGPPAPIINWDIARNIYLHRLFEDNDIRCLSQLRMRRQPFKDLVEQYMLRKDASSASGFGMDMDGRILADDIAWNAYVEAHPKAKDSRTTPFIYYDRVAQIYGNSTATGENAVTMEEEGYNQSETTQTDGVDFDFCDLDSQTISMPTQNQSNANDAGTSERPRRSRPHPVTEGEVNSPKKKRRSFSSVDDSLQTIAKEAKAVTELTRSLVEAQLRLVAAEYIPSIEDVAAKLRAMPNLTRQETVRAIGMFAGNGAARSTFMTIMEEDREEWLMGFLHGN